MKLLEGTLTDLLASLGQTVLGLCAWVLYLAGSVFDYAVSMSINSGLMAKIGAIKDGWEITRDLANLAFIFILIYIGIATILQLSNYGMKQLLIKVIIIALLVNFSLIIAQTIVNASNLLAHEFYNKIQPEKSAGVSVIGGEVKGIAAVFVAGLKPETLYKTEGTEFAEKGKDATAIQIITIRVFGSALALIASFVLFAGGILFLIRTIVLSFLMILAPLAFVAMALPYTKKYADQWWDALLKQAFFAPVFLFLFYLVVKIINNKSFASALKVEGEEAGWAALFFGKGDTNIALVTHFIILIGLMLAALIIAQKLGAVGAEVALSQGKKIRNKAQGYAGKIAKAPARFAGRQTVARVGEKIAESKRMQRITATMPRIGGWAADKAEALATVGGRKEAVDKLVKRGMGLSPKERATYLMSLGKRGIGDKQAQKEMFKQMPARERYEMVEKNPAFEPLYRKLMDKEKGILSVEEREKTEKVEKEVKQKKKIGRLDDKKNPITTNELAELHKIINAKEIREIADKGGEAAEKYFNSLKTFGKTINDVAQGLQKIGNKAQAAWMYSPGGQQTMKAHGFKTQAAKKATKEQPEKTERTEQKETKEKPRTRSGMFVTPEEHKSLIREALKDKSSTKEQPEK
jgi:hypothetical protein